MFATGLFMLALAAFGLFLAIFDPIEGARWGGIGVFLGCGAGGLTLAYLDAPSRKRRPKPGMARARATVLDGRILEGSVAGYQMVELTLEVRPKNGLPFEAKLKFSAGRLGRVEPGRSFDVLYDPGDPEKIELA